MSSKHRFLALCAPVVAALVVVTPAPAANGRIAFADVTGIGSMNPDGSGQWGVDLGVGDTSPAWSPDGSQLAVASQYGQQGLDLMNPDGSGEHALTTNSYDSQPAWSPDGATIAFIRNGQVWLIGSGGTKERQLTSDSGWNSHPSWSPDGKRIVFDGFRYQPNVYWGYSHIYVVDVASGAETQLTNAVGSDYDPSWSPDGAAIVFASERGGPTHLSTIAPDGSAQKQITDVCCDSQPAWAPDGSRIAFTRGGQVWTIARDGSDARQLTTGDGSNSPAWQPLGPAPGAGCTLWGTGANDLLVGTDGDDELCGEGGNDTLIGLGGADVLRGGEGDDWLAGGLGFDVLAAGPGDDTIDARDGGYDVIHGSAGFDRANADPGDVGTSIERMARSRDLLAWRPVSASSFEPTNPPVRAIDGRSDDWWSSGGYPPQWIEIDLQQPRTIAKLQLVAAAQPGGTIFLVLGRGPRTNGAYELLHQFVGPTDTKQALTFAPRRPWRGIRYLRVTVPSVQAPVGWISWHELHAYPPAPRRR